MIIISEYTLERKPNKAEFYVCSKEKSVCPCCDGKLKIIGNRLRKVIQQDGSFLCLIIRRYRCDECRQVHHELPDLLVPYKRYSTESIERILKSKYTEGTDRDCNRHADYTCEHSTAMRLRMWFYNLISSIQDSPSIYSNISKAFQLDSLKAIDLTNAPKGWMKKLLLILYRNKFYIGAYTRKA